jgi:thiamine biosynthesis lipoprotein
MVLNVITPRTSASPDRRLLPSLTRIRLSHPVRLVVISLFVWVGGIVTCRAQTAPDMVAGTSLTREAWLMGTLVRVTVSAASRSSAAMGSETVFREVERLEAALSSWRDDSEISRLNAAAVGEGVELSGEVVELLSEVAAWVQRTERAFDPAVGPLIDAWDLRGTGRQPTRKELDRALAASGFDAFKLDVGSRRAARSKAGAWLTAGGFGKGAALRAAARVLKQAEFQSALIDFGGQLVAVGAAPGRTGWPVAVAHPGRRDLPLVWLNLRDRSVATTAASERYVVVDGARLGHVLDPCTGRPVEAWGSVTVVHEDPMVADILSTALFVLGPERGSGWADSLSGVGVLFLAEVPGGVEAKWNPAIEPWLANYESSARAFGVEPEGSGWRTALIRERKGR